MVSRKLIKSVPVRDMDSVKARQVVVGKERDPQLLSTCEQIWENMSAFREQGNRGVNFTYGDQWADIIEVNGVKMTQRQYLQQTGNIVLQTNQIKNKVDTIVGVMVKEQNQPVATSRDPEESQYGELVTTGLQANCDLNKMQSLYIKYMKDICIRGLAVAHEAYEYRHGRLDSWTDYCEPNCVFFDSEMTDPRFWDVSLIGQFFDMTFNALTSRFAKTPRDYAVLKDLYPSQAQLFHAIINDDFRNKEEDRRLVFRTPEDPSKCRVFEVWRKETKPRYRLHDKNEGTEEVIDADDHATLKYVDEVNKVRKEAGAKAGWAEDEIPIIEKEFFIDEFWYCKYMAPDGTIIWEGESPYPGRQHPFTLIATPFVAGQIVGYMNDAIDHNIAMNRAIVLQDWLTRTQAKGVTVVPKKIVPNGDYKKFAKSWTAIDDMVFIDMKEGEEGLMPKVFYGNATSYNASELLNTYKSLLENSTAVSGAIQGKTPYSGTSGTLYAQMAANASTPIAALMNQFHTFLEELQTKKMKNIAKFYGPDRWAKIAGKIDDIFDNANMNLEEIAYMEMDVAVRENPDVGVYRTIMNDDAKEFLIRGLISFEEYLMITKVPYADKILQQRQARQQEAEQAGGMTPEQAQAVTNDAGNELSERQQLAMGMPMPER